MRKVMSWLRASVSWLRRAGRAVVNALDKRLLAPVREELRSIARDLTNVVREVAAPGPKRLGPRGLKGLGIRNVAALLAGSERNDQLTIVDSGDAAYINAEVKEARRQLAIGAGTVAVNVLAAVYYPGLFVVGTLGLVYQARFSFREAYRALVHERRINIYGQNVLIIAGAMLSGSLIALTLGVFAGSVLRWVVAKTESRAQKSVASVFSRQPRFVCVPAGDAEVEVEFDRIQIGDVVIINAGGLIPVDGVVVRGMGSVDQHVLTGESRPVDKGPEDNVQAGGVLLTGKLYVQVERSGDDTVAAQIARMLTDTSGYKRRLRTDTERQLNRLLIPFLALSALTGAIWGLDSALAVLWTIPGYRMMFFGPLTMLSFMHATSRKGILLKSGQALPRLNEVDTVIFDKTGTLTMEQPSAGRIFGFADCSEAEILALAAAAERNQSHPIALAIKHMARDRGIRPPPVDEAAVSVGFGVHVTISERKIRVGSDRLMSLSGVELSTEARLQQKDVHGRGNSLIFVARDNELIGAIEVRPTIRPEAGELIAELQRRGKQVLIVSGDHEEPTRALAEQLGVDRYFSQVLPEDKSKVIAQLQSEGRVVCFVGDGINDSIGLQRADVSISMRGASSIATTVAQVVFMSGDLRQMSSLFDMAETFEHYMRINRLATSLPSFFLVGGTLLFGWSYLSIVLLTQVTTPIVIYNLYRSMAEHETALPDEKALPAPAVASGYPSAPHTLAMA